MTTSIKLVPPPLHPNAEFIGDYNHKLERNQFINKAIQALKKLLAGKDSC